jgi:hypothetical protein
MRTSTIRWLAQIRLGTGQPLKHVTKESTARCLLYNKWIADGFFLQSWLSISLFVRCVVMICRSTSNEYTRLEQGSLSLSHATNDLSPPGFFSLSRGQTF